MDSYSQLTAKVREVGSIWRKVLFLEGVSFLIAVVIPFLTLVFFLDNFVHLPAWGRSIVLIVSLSLAVTIFFKTIISAFIKSFSSEKIAIHIERKYPEFHNRLINAIQLGKVEPMSPVTQVIVEDSLLESEKFDLGKAISRDYLRKYLLLSVLASAVFVFYGLFFREHFNNALARFLTPYADIPPITLTRLSVSPGNLVILSGEDVEVRAFVGGKIPRRARIAYKIGSGEWKLSELKKSEQNIFTHTFRKVSKNIGFYVMGGDARTSTYTIMVKQRPNILNLKVSLKFPDYTGLPPMVESDSNGSIRTLAGTVVQLEAKADKKIEKAEIVWKRIKVKGEENSYAAGAALPMEVCDERILRAGFDISEDVVYQIHVTDTHGFTNKDPVDYSIEAIGDNRPIVRITKPGKNISVEPSDTIPLEIKVTDDYGIKDVSVFLKPKGAGESVLTTWKKSKHEKEAVFEHTLKLKDLGVKPGQVITYYAEASDWNNLTGPGTGKSHFYTLTILAPEEVRDLGKAQAKSVKEKLLRIISLQETNRGNTEDILKTETAPRVLLRDATRRQISIREFTVELADGLGGELFILEEALCEMISGEMLEAIRQFEQERLSEVIHTQGIILGKLRRLANQMSQSETQLEMQNVIESLEEIIKKEKEIRTFSKALYLRGVDKFSSRQVEKIVAGQRVLVTSLSWFQDGLVSTMQEEFLSVAKRIDELRISSNMKKIASYVESGVLKEALSLEDIVIESLELIQSVLKAVIFGQAKDWMKNFKETIEETGERLKKLSELQEAITELTQELNKTKDLSEAEKAKIGKMAELQGKMEDVIENLAEDLKLFPEAPISNELLSKMREVYEDIEKSIEAKNMPAIEIAVAMDEGILEALKSTTERVEDFEMWLPEEPDNIKWNLESFDVSEIPEIPLVELPDELEDLVGELIESQEDVNELTENVTANWMSADMPMGWGVDEGGISNFSAKGKSGNRLPDSDEITGRSGAGRPGKTSGEIVESFAKDLEGSPTPPRKTMDPYQKGYVEEENPLSQTGATGGGKQSGYGGEGFSGTAPALDKRALEEMAGRQSRIHSNAQNLKAALSLLFLPTGDIDRALLLMGQAGGEIRSGDFRNLPETQQNILHTLKNTYRSITGSTYIQVEARTNMPGDIKREILAAGDENYPREYKKLVTEYFKAISEANFQ